MFDPIAHKIYIQTKFTHLCFLYFSRKLATDQATKTITNSDTATVSAPQKGENEPLRAIENISTTITASSTVGSTITTTTTTATGNNDDDSSAAAVTASNNNNQSPSAKSILAKTDKDSVPHVAMIKPTNVLTHVIGNFVIQESNEPFPVTRQRYADDSDDTPRESFNLFNIAYMCSALCLWKNRISQLRAIEFSRFFSKFNSTIKNQWIFFWRQLNLLGGLAIQCDSVHPKSNHMIELEA